MRALASLIPTLCLLFACGGNEAGDDTPMGAPCSDTVDNDGDGLTDFPEDPGCTHAADDTEDSPASPQCSDGRDNDGDGKIDFPSDPGCTIPQQDDESDDCPDGAGCPQCGNGRDDDGNGTTDYPDDPGCESAADTTEIILNPNACGAGLMIRQLPATGMAMGMLDGTSTSNIMSPCGGGAGAPAIAFLMVLTEPKVVVASTDSAGTTADTVLDIRGADCMAAASEIACNDDISGQNTNSALTKALPAGTYYLIVQGHDASSVGNFELKVELFAGEGSTCSMQEDCGPGLVCRTPVGMAQMICTKPVCSDGIDDDMDGKTDHPNDPGCGSPADDTETDDCPSGPNCPDCSDGTDNDGDMQTDYPNDTSCHAAGDTSEACVTSEAVETIVGPMTNGDTTGLTDDYDPTCNSSLTSDAPDKLYRLDLPATSTLNINMTNLSTGYNSVTALLNSTCGGTAVKCSDPANMVNTNLAAGTYYLVVDGYATDDVGTYTIAVSGTVAPGGSCEGLLYQSGALTCPTGFLCEGTAGARTCRTQCTDGIDNNGNGKKDYPQDPGCASPADNDENTVCPGAMCPACSDGMDNDGDMKIDYPLDPSCLAAAGTSESCVQSEPVGTITSATTTGDTTGQVNDYNPTCGTSSTTGTGPDLAYQVDLPKMATVSFDLTNAGGLHDSVHALLPSSCQAPEIACQDPATMDLTNVPAGRYFLVVDGYSSTSDGPFTITTSGTVAPGGSCEGALFTSGAFTCVAGTTCMGNAGSKTCRSGCSDGIDNNGNGKIDYPADPGCDSAVDNTEDTVCPGAMCPACSNMADDDMDSRTDYPADFGCVAASGTTEVFCAADPDFGGQISAFTTNGTLVGAADNYDTSCQTNTGNDKTYALVLPVPVTTITIDTEGSQASDTVLTLKDAACSAELGCDDDGSTGTQSFQSKLTVANLPAGAYAINVNGYSTTNNLPFVLHVKGIVAPQTTCTSPLFAAGVLACPTGTTCTNTKCQ